MNAHLWKWIGGALLLCAVLQQPAAAQAKLDIYGYFATRFEKSYQVPELVDGRIERTDGAAEWSNPFLNVMMQHQLGERFRVFLNLSGSGSGDLRVGNYWGEFAAAPYFNLRLGRIYRKLGLYNELLDAVPTYYGIEPPELFDADHLIVSRTTTMMVYGNVALGPGALHYSLSTDNGEGEPVANALPVGWDVHFRKGIGYRLGFSGYSSGGPATSDVGIGDGAPRSGVLPWMAADDFRVLGAYGEATPGNLTLQAAYWWAGHDAERDPAGVLAVVEGAGPNAHQLDRFLLDPSAPATLDNVDPDGDYQVQTWYVRLGYSFYRPIGELAPYVQWDWYSNPETIASKTFGGDAEAGEADDGVFNKATLGIVYRPVPNVAIKLDGSSHIYRLGGQTLQYPELRLDVSYVFGQ